MKRLEQAEQPEQAAASMTQIFEGVRKLEKGVIVLDGGDNQDAVDEGLPRRADLVVMPVVDGLDDFEVAIADL